MNSRTRKSSPEGGDASLRRLASAAQKAFSTGRPVDAATGVDLGDRTVVIFEEADGDPGGQQWAAAAIDNGFSAIRVGYNNRLAWRQRPQRRVCLVVLTSSFPVSAADLEIVRLSFPLALVVVHHPSTAETLSTVASVDANPEGGYVVLEPEHTPHEFVAWFRTHSYEAQKTTAQPRPAASLDLTRRLLRIGSETIPLHEREIQLLRILSSYGDTACPTDRLCHEFLGADGTKQRRLLWQYVHQLRGKLGEFGPLIQCRRGLGYRCLLDVNFSGIGIRGTAGP